MIVLDCSVVGAWLLPDEENTYANTVRTFIQRHTPSVFVPCLFYLEMINVIEMARRRKRIDKNTCHKALALLERLPIIVDMATASAHTVKSARMIAEHYTLSIYDASYLELSKRHNMPLATLDKALRRAAESEEILYHV